MYNIANINAAISDLISDKLNIPIMAEETTETIVPKSAKVILDGITTEVETSGFYARTISFIIAYFPQNVTAYKIECLDMIQKIERLLFEIGLQVDDYTNIPIFKTESDITDGVAIVTFDIEDNFSYSQPILLEEGEEPEETYNMEELHIERID